MGQSAAYRREAGECRAYAERQPDAKSRNVMLQIAENWEFAATELERHESVGEGEWA
jgi:hypothetical protein